jgi:hypothetical protein
VEGKIMAAAFLVAAKKSGLYLINLGYNRLSTGTWNFGNYLENGGEFSSRHAV